MIAKLFIFILFIFNVLNAEPIVKITSMPIHINEFQIGYFVDTSEKMSFAKVQKEKFTAGNNRLSLGMNADITWVKIVLNNETNSSQKLFIHNASAYHSAAIHFYEVENGTLLNDIRYEPINKLNTDKMDGAEAVYTLDLRSGQSKTVYMQSYFLAYQLFELSIFDERYSKEDLVHKYMPIVILFSILFTLAFYYFILFVSSRHREYLHYSLYLISSSVFIAYSYGMLSHYFHVYGELALRLNAFVMLPPVFLSYFVKSIFNTEKNYKIENTFLDSIIILFVLTYLYSFFEYYQAIEFASLLYLYLLIGMLWIGISLYRKNAPLVKFFLIAHIFYLIFSLIAILFYNNGIEYNDMTSHAIAIGTMIEALMLGFLVSYRIKLLESENQRKERLILTDGMTSLYNKSYFDETFERQYLIQRRNDLSFTLMIIDIDYFKQFNDYYGHLAGDKALISVAQRLKKSLKRPTDMAFRIGGEEFAVLCSGMEKEKAFSFADNLRKSIEELEIEHQESSISNYITVSIGLYTVPSQNLSSAEQIYKYADDALYTAKAQGRNQVCCV